MFRPNLLLLEQRRRRLARAVGGGDGVRVGSAGGSAAPREGVTSPERGVKFFANV